MMQGQDALTLCLVAVAYSDLAFRLQTDIYKHSVLQAYTCHVIHCTGEQRRQKTGENTTMCNYVPDVYQSGFFYFIPPKNHDFQNNTIVS